MLTTKEAGSALGVRSRTIVEYIQRGLIHAEKFGRDYMISEDELERFKRNRRTPGNPGTPRKNERPMPSTIYINSHELAAARHIAARLIAESHESSLGADAWFDLDVAERNRIADEADEEAAAIFDRPEYLNNLLRTMQMRDPALARRIEEEVEAEITRKRRGRATNDDK